MNAKRILTATLSVLACLGLLSLPGLGHADTMGKEKKAPAAGKPMATKYTKLADNFVFMIDESGTMGKPFGATTKLGATKAALTKANAGIPEDLGYMAAMYAFAPKWRTLVAPGKYNGATFDKAIASLPEAPASSVDPTPLGGGLKQLTSEMKGMKGKTIVYLFTDGKSTDDVNPVSWAEGVAKAGGCFYVVNLSDTKGGNEVLKKISKVNACSTMVEFEEFVATPEACIGQVCRLN